MRMCARMCLCAVGRGSKSSSLFGLIVTPPSFPLASNPFLLSPSFHPVIPPPTFLPAASSFSRALSLAVNSNTAAAELRLVFIHHFSATAVEVAVCHSASSVVRASAQIKKDPHIFLG